MATVVDALIVTLGLDASKFKKGADTTESRLLSMAKKTLVAVGAFKILKNTVSGFVNAAESVGRFADMNGIAAEEVSTLDNAMKITGGSMGEMRGTVAKLNKDMNGLYPVNPFAVIGIRATDAQNKIKPMTTLLTEVAGKMEGMSRAKQADIGEKLGLDSSTIVLLQKGRAEVSKLFEEQKKLGQITKDDTKTARLMNEAMARLKIAWNASGASLARVLTPALTWMSDKLVKLVIWMRQNSTFVTVFFGAIAAIVTAILVPSMYALAKATVLATWPFILIGLAIAAVSAFIAVLVDDYQTWKAGGQSAFGDTWKIAEQAFDGMIAAGKKFIDFIKPLFEGLSTIVAGVMSYIVGIFTGDMGKINEATSMMMEGLKAIWDGYKEYIYGIMDNIIGFVTDKIAAVTGKFKEVGKFFGIGSDEEDSEDEAVAEKGPEDKKESEGGMFSGISSAAKNIGSFFGMGDGAAEATKPSAVSNNNQTSSNSSEVQIGAITVQTQAIDAPGIAKDLGDAIRDNGAMVNQAEGGMF